VTKFTIRNYRRSASKKQGGNCFWCDHPMITFGENGGRQHTRQETADHLTPRSRGGGDGRKNVVAACFLCNIVRKDLPLEVWLPRVKLRLKQQGNPSFFEVILSRLEKLGISLPIVGQPSNGPDGQTTADCPPRKDMDPAPQG
jgi:hypothetical protein